MSRLVVVSNRVPHPGRDSAGGLAVAVQAALRERGGVWMGWSGNACEGDEPGPLSIRRDGPTTYALTDLTERDLSEYYAGFANSVLWPLCHYRIDLTDYSRRDVSGYFRVNRLFAERLLPLLREDDLIWIHDYHLIPLGEELRRLGVRNRIGFFMHIPWPAPDVLLTIPVQEELLRAMTSFDLLGFQTEHDADNFALCLRRSGIARPEPGGGPGDPAAFRTSTRSFRIGAFPISIDSDAFADSARKAIRSPALQRFHTLVRDQRLIVGVDRLDYTKGLPQRMAGFRRFLETHPQWQQKVTFLQITPKSRSGIAQYDALQSEIAEIAGQIQGTHGRLDWTPVRYVNRAFGQPVLAALYRMAKVALVTPLRDGMNLVAKEYVAAQDEEDPGVLVLSRFAGAASELGGGAVLINPYDEESIVQGIAQAVSMPQEARRERHAAMAAALRRNTIFHWCENFLSCLDKTAGAVPLSRTLAPQ